MGWSKSWGAPLARQILAGGKRQVLGFVLTVQLWDPLVFYLFIIVITHNLRTMEIEDLKLKNGWGIINWNLFIYYGVLINVRN